VKAAPATPPRGDIEESMAAAPGDIEVSIAQLVKFTGCSREEAIAALKASNNDAHAAAANMILALYGQA
jgi:hypothetical protein